MTGPSLIQRVVRRINKTLLSVFFLDQWVVMTGKNISRDSLEWSAFRPLVPDKDRYWADPFIVEKEGRRYVFVEEKILSAGLGRIACLTLDGDGNLISNQVVLERPYHLSYPFIFEYQGEMYMLPETAANRAVELYRCRRFPDQWQFVKTALKDIYAVDATLFERDKKWWLFANVKEEGGSSLDALHLFYADSPLADQWTAHPLNPIVRDIRSARPAGRVFIRDGEAIRPSQDSSRRYGFALKFNRIDQLNQNEYRETTVSSFFPKGGKILATHTFNQVGDFTVIDAIIRRRK